MDPAAIRPDRDTTGRQIGRLYPLLSLQKMAALKVNVRSLMLAMSKRGDPCDLQRAQKEAATMSVEDIKVTREKWLKRLPVEIRTTLMMLRNIDSAVGSIAVSGRV